MRFANIEECKNYFKNLKKGYLVNLKRGEDVYIFAEIISADEQGIKFNIYDFNYEINELINLKIEGSFKYEELVEMEVIGLWEKLY